MIGIIGAMASEIDGLKEIMTDTVIKKISSVEFYSGRINGTAVVVAQAGVGKVNAAVTAETMILNFNVETVINIGVAGGLAENLKIGDVVVADKVVEHDMDTTAVGDEPGFITGLDCVYIDTDKETSELIYKCAQELEINTVCGVIASGDLFVSEESQRERIKGLFDAAAAEMEGASIGHVCAMNGVKFAVLRAMSDCANDDSKVDFPTFAAEAAKKSIEIIKLYLKYCGTKSDKGDVKRIKSFEVDHTKLEPGFYVSRQDCGVITYDMRFCKPNTGVVLDNESMHTIEHMIATFARNSEIADDVIYFGPMGCQTGFYFLVRDTVTPEKALEVIKKALKDTIAHNGEVFGASAVECGNYRTLNLEKAKTACRSYLEILHEVGVYK